MTTRQQIIENAQGLAAKFGLTFETSENRSIYFTIGAKNDSSFMVVTVCANQQFILDMSEDVKKMIEETTSGRFLFNCVDTYTRSLVVMLDTNFFPFLLIQEDLAKAVAAISKFQEEINNIARQKRIDFFQKTLSALSKVAIKKEIDMKIINEEKFAFALKYSRGTDILFNIIINDVHNEEAYTSGIAASFSVKSKLGAIPYAMIEASANKVAKLSRESNKKAELCQELLRLLCHYKAVVGIINKKLPEVKTVRMNVIAQVETVCEFSMVEGEFDGKTEEEIIELISEKEDLSLNGYLPNVTLVKLA